MLYNLWRWIQLWLPYGFILWLYRRNRALPTNIKTREGNNYKAVLITEDYGLLFSVDKYIKNRGLYLKEQKRMIDNANAALIEEINALPFEEKERLYGYLVDSTDIGVEK